MGQLARINAETAPTIPLTLGQCVIAEQALSRLSSQVVPAKMVYRITKLLRLIRAKVQDYEAERLELVKVYSGDQAEVPPDKRVEFFQMLQQILNTPTEIAAAPLMMADLDVFPSLTADTVLQLGPLFMEEEG